MSADVTTEAMTAPVLWEERGAVAIMTLNRADVKNAADRAMAEALAEALTELDNRDDLSVGVITGAGGTFCTGMDLKAFMRGELPMVEGRGFLGLAQQPPAKPLIAAIEGYALAGGFEAALAADMIVAAEDAVFGLPEVKRGLVAGGGGLLRLAELLPPNIAKEIVLTGGNVSADRLAAFGLVNHLVASGEALTVALDLAASIARNGPLAVRVSKQVMIESPSWSAADRFDRQRDVIVPVFQSEDAAEGARAFSERREPLWRGR